MYQLAAYQTLDQVPGAAAHSINAVRLFQPR
jgi:hypothetical protein